MTTIRVAGVEDPRPEQSPLERGLPGSVQVKRSVLVQAARAGAPRVELDHLQPDDVLELEFQDGLRLWTRVEDVPGDLRRSISRSEAAADTLDLPSQLDLGPASRSATGWAIKALKVLGIDVAGEVTDFVAARVEGKLQPGPGLYQCSAGGPTALDPVRNLGGPGPVLVFLHGTASSTDGSFGDLWRGDEHAPIRGLLKHYEGRVLALQHRTLTESPAENAVQLAEALARLLPAGAEVHLVSHSRGGLIGELLARGMRVGAAPFTEDELRLFEGRSRARDLKALRDLNRILQDSRLQVTRFVRVACPARGTTLADRRLDRYFSVLVNAASLIPGLAASPVYDALTSLLAGVLSKRTEPEELPGLEAMMPTSPLVRMLNRPDIATGADLHVLGGDLAPSGFWGRLKTLATDLYYRDDHDLVVNTPAMLGGVDRQQPIRYWIDTGAQVTHFHYFSRSDTARRLVAALTGSSAEFRTLTVPPSVVTSADYTKRAAANQPYVFVLPGIMGSQLSVGRNVVWMNLMRLAWGGLNTLGMAAPGVTATGLLRDGYAAVCAHLARSHAVVDFPYDWRQPLDRIAEQLRKGIEAILPQAEAAKQPIRLLAHSMGGLVVRAMLATEAGQRTWGRMCRHPGARFIMLGTPNGGSHAIPAMLIGRDALVKQLALLDLRNDYAGLLGTIASFEGVLDLLPRGGSVDLYDHAQWQRMLELDAPQRRGFFGGEVDLAASAGFRWVVPDRRSLERARRMSETIAASPLDPTRTVYVAGVADATPCDVEFQEDAPEGRRVRVMASPEGDGRVLWSTGIPANVRTYYMDTVHGDLANDPRHFPALVELLNTGTTSKLPARPPVRRAVAAIFEMREPLPDMVPDESELVASALGGRRRREAAAEAGRRVNVRIVHDNLTNARQPVLVGHYEQDVIVAGEKYLDQRLGGRLSELLQMGLYPGPPGTAAAVLNDTPPGDLSVHPGAVIAGLGRVGELSPGRLTSTLAHAMTVYGSDCVGRERRRRQSVAGDGDPAAVISAPLTTVLVGSGEGGLSMADCVQAVVRAVDIANRRLRPAAPNTRSPDQGPRLVAQIDRLEIIELYEDRAIEAVHALRRLVGSAEFKGFHIEELLVAGDQGQRRAWYNQDPSWWQRLRVTTDRNGTLRFEAVTQAARARAELRPTQRSLVEQLVQQAIETTWADRELGYTLFELLIPSGFKPHAPDRRKLAIVMDVQSAGLPWELLQDRFDAESDPVSVSTGLIRQLLEPSGREQILRAPGKTAFVLGNPRVADPRFPSLPGAAEEAAAVGTLLSGHGYQVVQMLDQAAHPLAVFAELHRQPWQILHLAAHGVFEFRSNDSERPVSGLVLDQGLFFTAAEAEQMRYVPDLVFINCCHLGQTAGEVRKRTAYHKLAANLATQFIRMGTRAVIAAGWEVDDAAAKAFAKTFYQKMLDGSLFGDAVLSARKETYERHPNTNTWGAYQCYGDPSFSLFTKPAEGADFTPAAEAELVAWLNAFGIRARLQDGRGVPLCQELERQIGGCPPAWRQSVALCAAAGQAYADLGEDELALVYLETIPNAERAKAPIAALEVLANCWTRVAGKRLATDPSQSEQAGEYLHKAQELLENLIAIGETAERCSLMGAVMKRRAMLPSNNAAKRRAALAEMRRWYAKALDSACDPAARDYPLANRLAADIVLSWTVAGTPAARPKRKTAAAKPAKGIPTEQEIQEALEELRKLSAELLASQTDFFSLVGEANRLLLEMLAKRQLDERQLEAEYREAFSRGATARQRDSVKTQLLFFRLLAEYEAPEDVKQQLVERLKLLENNLLPDAD